MNTFAELARLIENLVRLGTVHAVQLNPARVQVKTGKLITCWLPWTVPQAGATKHWNVPSVGEQVILLSPSGLLNAGVVIRGLWSDANPAPSDQQTDRISYPDGAVLEYDYINHVLNAHLPQGASASIKAPAGLRIEGDVTLIGNLTQTGTTTATGDVVAGGISLKGHTHRGDSGGTTGAPQ